MSKILCKKGMAVLLTVLMLFSMIPAFSLTASAGTFTPINGVSVSVSGQSSESLSGGTLTVTAKGGVLSKKTATVTVYNDLDSTAQLSFTYNASSANSFTIGGSSASASGTYSSSLAAGGSVVLSIQSKSGLSGTTATLTLSGFSVIAVKESSNVTFGFDSKYGSVTADGAAVNSGDVKEVSFSTGSALVATPVSGAKFLGWVDGSGLIVSTATSYTVKPASDMTLKAIFVGADSSPHFSVGGASQKSQSAGLLGLSKLYYYTVGSSYIFEDLNSATAFAASNASNKTLVLLNDATLPAGNYTIPSGVTLLIPFDSGNTMYKNEAVSVYSTGSEDIYVTPTRYRTLTLADGANLTVNGELSLSAKHRAAQGSRANAGSPMGAVSFINMQGNSKITVANGATFYAYGFVTGSGSVEVLNGGNVYEYFQFNDFRGGTQSTDMDNGVFPLSQYYVQNIEVPLTLNYGAKEYAYTTIYMSSADFGSAVAFIGPSSAMFNLTSGSVTKWYDGSNDRIYITSNGNMTVSSINMSVGTSSINSANYELPINSNYTVTVESGSITINQDVAFLPGSEIIVSEGASATLGSGKNIYIYDLDQWGNYTFGDASLNNPLKPINYAPGKTYNRTEADLKDALLMIYGSVDSSAGYVYTTESGASVLGAEGGTAVIGKVGSQTETYQMVQGGGACKLPDGTLVSASYYDKIPITSAKLQNADGSYVETGYTPGTYTFTNGSWVKTTCTHDYTSVTNFEPTCEETGSITYTCKDTVNCGYSYVEEISATGHTLGDEVKENVIEPTCTTDGSYDSVKYCTVCGEEISREIVVTKGTGHTYNEVVTDPTCTTEGYTTYTCPCGDTYVDNQVPATGHIAGEETKENIVEATCTTAGSYEKVVKCTACGTEMLRETVEVPVLGHNYSAVVTAPTCTTEGYTTYTCSCGDSYVADQVDALGHNYEVVETAPTCTAAGNAIYTCSNCGDSYSVELPVIDHTAGEAVTEKVVDATCTQEGSYDSVVYCTVCSGELSRTTVPVAVIPHTVFEVKVENSVAPTCAVEGSYENVSYCVCGEVLDRETITVDKLAHTAGEAVTENSVAPTCTVEGSYDSVTYCVACGTEMNREKVTVEKAAHIAGSTAVENVVEATCAKEGSYENVTFCAVCSAEISREKVVTEKADHTPFTSDIENIVYETCTTAGSYDIVTYCACGAEISRTTSEIPALGHDIVVDEAVEPTYENTGLTEGSHCDYCGEVIVPQETIPSIEYVLGDANHDDVVDILDLIALKNAVLDSAEYTVVVDMNKDGVVDSIDVVALKKDLWEKF